MTTFLGRTEYKTIQSAGQDLEQQYDYSSHSQNVATISINISFSQHCNSSMMRDQLSVLTEQKWTKSEISEVNRYHSNKLDQFVCLFRTY